MVTERKRVDGVKIISYGHQVPAGLPAGLVRRSCVRRRDGLPVTAMDEINTHVDYSSPTPTQEYSLTSVNPVSQQVKLCVRVWCTLCRLLLSPLSQATACCFSLS